MCIFDFIIMLVSPGGDLDMSSLNSFFDKLHKKYGDIVRWNLFNRTQVEFK